MSRILSLGLVSVLALSTVACTDSERARQAATFADQPADIVCWTYGTENFRGRSTGKIEYDEGERISFVDASNGRLTTVEGDCRVTYLGEDGDASVPAPASSPPMPAAPVAAE